MFSSTEFLFALISSSFITQREYKHNLYNKTIKQLSTRAKKKIILLAKLIKILSTTLSVLARIIPLVQPFLHRLYCKSVLCYLRKKAHEIEESRKRSWDVDTFWAYKFTCTSLSNKTDLWKLIGVLTFLWTRIHPHTRIHPLKCASGTTIITENWKWNCCPLWWDKYSKRETNKEMVLFIVLEECYCKSTDECYRFL